MTTPHALPMLHDSWYAVAWSHEIKRTPLARTILGRELLFRRSPTGQLHVTTNVCPHRQARLSTGKQLADGRIQCPYHAWEFDLDGRCVNVPTLPEGARVPPQACLTSYPAVEEQSLVWVWMGRPGGESTHPVPSFDYDSLGAQIRHQRLPSTRWQANYIDLIENALDPSHIQTVHPNTLGPNWAATVGNVSIEAFENGRGFTAVSGEPLRTVEDRNLIDFRKLLRLPVVKTAHYRFDFGGVTQVRYEYADGCSDMAYAAITPSDDQHTWVFFGILRSHMRNFIGDALQQTAMFFLQREDLAAIANLSRERPADLRRRVSVGSDRMGNLYLKQLIRLLEAEGRGPDAAGRRPSLPLFDEDAAQ